MSEIGFSIPDNKKAVRALRAFCDEYLGDYKTITLNENVTPADSTVCNAKLPPVPAEPQQAEEHPATVAPTPPTPESDSRGVPWSAEHHAGTKTQTNAGNWKAKKGGDKTAREAYEAQFIGQVTPTPTPTPEPPPVTPGATFADVMTKSTQMIAGGLITVDGVTAIVKQFDMSNLTELANKQEHVPAVMAALEALG